MIMIISISPFFYSTPHQHTSNAKKKKRIKKRKWTSSFLLFSFLIYDYHNNYDYNIVFLPISPRLCLIQALIRDGHDLL